MIVSLSAATTGFASAPEAVAIASDAGFAHVGLRLDLTPPTTKELELARRRLSDTGCEVFDIEVALLGTDHVADDRQHLVDQAAELGARHLLCVGEGNDRSTIAEQLADLNERCAAVGVAVVVEWMPFRSVATLGDALEVISLTGSEHIGLVVDALHLHRSGGRPADLRRHADRVAYLQLCDAPARFDLRSVTDRGAALTHEARTARLLPGEGDLPLQELLDTFPAAPVSLEVPPVANLDRKALVDHALSVRHAAGSALGIRSTRTS